MADNVGKLINDLRSKRQYVRQRAAEKLGKIGDPRAVESLITAMRDEDFDVRYIAAKVLAKIDPNWPRSEAAKKQIPEFITALKDGDCNVRYEAAEALGKIGDARAVKPLIALLKNDTNYRQMITTIIEKIVNLNLPIQKIHPYLICDKCFLRSEKKGVRARIFKKYFLVVCRGCGSSLSFIKNVTQIIGVIGSSVTNYQVDGIKVYVSLWSEVDKKSRNANIDMLEIRNLPGISYDYAINAVLVTLKNDVSRPRDYVKGIPVVIRGNPPIPK